MTTVVLDASALVASVLREPGADRADAGLEAGAKINAVNFAEVVGVLERRKVDPPDIERLRTRLAGQIAPVAGNLAYRAGRLEGVTRHRGLSLGDRFCLAFAESSGALLLTSDSRLAEAAVECGVVVELIR